MRLLLIVGILLFAVPQTAGAAERVVDGSFEGSVCSPTDCTSSAWTEQIVSGMVDSGPICKAGTGGCTANGGTFRSPSAFARLGYTLYSAQSPSTYVEQALDIPAAPATLTVYLRVNTLSPFHTGQFTASIDGTAVAAVADSALGFDAYAPVTVDVSGFASPGSHTLRLAGFSSFTPGGLSGPSDSFEVDDVSLDAADAAGAPAAPLGTCNGKPATVPATDASELILGTAGPDVIAAGAGDDVVKAGGGNDLVCGGAGNDELRGQGAKDRLLGELGKDKLTGGGGRDTCDGGGGKDKGSSCERGPDA